DLRSTKLEGLTGGFGTPEKLQQPSSHITDENGLELGCAPAYQRQHGTALDHGGEPNEEVIILAVSKARPDDRPLRGRLSNCLFSLSLCSIRESWRCQARAEGR